MLKPKAILFDLDDTILAFSDASSVAWEKCCEEFVLKNKVDFSSAKLLQAINTTRDWYWSDPVRHKKGRENLRDARREVFRYALENFSFRDEDKIFETADSYTFLQESLWKLFDGLPEAFDELRKKNIIMAIVTNGTSDVQRGKLSRLI